MVNYAHWLGYDKKNKNSIKHIKLNTLHVDIRNKFTHS